MDRGGFVVRRLTSGDVGLAAEAIARLKPDAEALAQEEPCSGFLSDERNVLVVAFDGAEAIGYAIGYVLDRADRTAPMLLLYEIEVDEGYRRRGVGRTMVERVKRVARSHGAYKMWVLAGDSNAAARALYRSAGGVELEQNLLIEWRDILQSDGRSSQPRASREPVEDRRS